MRKTGKPKIGERVLAVQLAITMGVMATGCGGIDAADAGADPNIQMQDTEEATTEDGSGVQQDGEITGRYVESSVLLPAGRPGQSMEVLADGSIAYYDGETQLYTARVEELFALNGEAEHTEEELWTKQKKITDPASRYVSHSAIAKDGSLAMICMEFQEEDFTVSLLVTDSSDKQYEIGGSFPDGDYIVRLFWKNPEELYGVSVRGKVCRVDFEKRSLQQLFTGVSTPETLAFSDTQLFAVENERIEIFDLDSHKMQEPDTVLNDFCQEAFEGMLGTTSGNVGAILMPEKDAWYLACGKGLFRHVAGGSVMEEMLNGQKSVLGDMLGGICNAAALEDGSFLLLHSSGKLVRIFYDPNASAFSEQELKIYSLYENDRIRQAIQLFCQQNPEINVQYEVGIPADSSVTLTDAQKNLNLRLMGQDAPDLLVMDGLDYRIYQEKGMLTELTAFAGALPQESSIFPNLLEACKTDGALYSIPMTINLSMMVGRQTDLDAIADMKSLADRIEMLRSQNSTGVLTGSFHPEQELAQLLDMTGDTFMNGNTLDREALTDFLEQAKRIADANMAGVEQAISEQFGTHRLTLRIGNKVDMMMVELGQIAYGTVCSAAMDVGAMDVFLKQEGYGMKLWKQQGKNGFFPCNEMAIPETAQNMEEAQQFLRLMLSASMQQLDLYDGFPVTREAFDELCRQRKEGDEDYICMGGSFRMPDGTVKEYYSEWPRALVMEQIRDMTRTLELCVRKNPWMDEAILKYGPNALLGSMTVLDAVEEIARSVAIYLAE